MPISRQIQPVVTMVEDFAAAEAADRAYWWALSPEERLRETEVLRQLNYGHRATTRLQRFLELAEHPSS